jgi:LmbE family N-acetylglucosaminyl deacetylase
VPAKSTRALFFTAHCDDAELWAGGTIRLWADGGQEVVVAVTMHERLRQQESRSAAAVLGFRPVFLDDSLDLEDEFLRLLEQLKPEVVVTHPDRDPHPMHSRVHAGVVGALTRLRERKKFPSRWYAFDTYYLTRNPPGCPVLVDVHDTFNEKLRALSCHRSQRPEELVRLAEHMGALNGFRARVEIAEAFHPFDLLGRWPRIRTMP